MTTFLKNQMCALLLFRRDPVRLLFLRSTAPKGLVGLEFVGGEIKDGESPEQAMVARLADTLTNIGSADYEPVTPGRLTLLSVCELPEAVVHLFCDLNNFNEQVISSKQEFVWVNRRTIQESSLEPDLLAATLRFFDSPVVLTAEELLAEIIKEAVWIGGSMESYSDDVDPARGRHQRRLDLCRLELLTRVKNETMPSRYIQSSQTTPAVSMTSDQRV